MIKSEAVATSLKKSLELMETLKGHELGGYALIIPPEGDEVQITLLGTHPDTAPFYKMLAEKLMIAKDSSTTGLYGTNQRVR